MFLVYAKCVFQQHSKASRWHDVFIMIWRFNHSNHYTSSFIDSTIRPSKVTKHTPGHSNHNSNSTEQRITCFVSTASQTKWTQILHTSWQVPWSRGVPRSEQWSPSIKSLVEINYNLMIVSWNSNLGKILRFCHACRYQCNWLHVNLRHTQLVKIGPKIQHLIKSPRKCIWVTSVQRRLWQYQLES